MGTTRTVFVKKNFIAFYPMLEMKEGFKLVNKGSILRNLKQRIKPKINRSKETVMIKNHQIENKTKIIIEARNCHFKINKIDKVIAFLKKKGYSFKYQGHH